MINRHILILLAISNAPILQSAEYFQPAFRMDEEFTEEKLHQLYQTSTDLHGLSKDELNKRLTSNLKGPDRTWPERRVHIALLIYAGADIETNHRIEGTSLKNALLHLDFHLTDFLLNRTTDGMIKKKCILKCNNKKLAELVLLHGADINTQNKRGLSALHMAVASDSHYDKEGKLTEFLIAQGANINAFTHSGYTPLAETALQQNFMSRLRENIYLLLHAGAETHWRITRGGSAGRTAADILRNALSNKKKSLIEIELADYIDRYAPTLQGRIVRSIILNLQSNNYLPISKKASDLLAREQLTFIQSNPMLWPALKITLERSMSELRPTIILNAASQVIAS